jgi:hypothetical protein
MQVFFNSFVTLVCMLPIPAFQTHILLISSVFLIPHSFVHVIPTIPMIFIPSFQTGH